MTESSIPEEDQVSQICVQCGFCCSGLLYDHARLDDDEIDFARGIGLEPVQVEGRNPGQKRFAFPCPHLSGSACSIYDRRRPHICSRFFCELATRFNEGDISQAEALDKVHEAQGLMKRIEPLLLPGENWAAARGRWFSNRRKTPPNREAAEFQLLMTALNLFLDQNFRKERQRVIG
jgi:hypothetical protein